MKMSALHLPDDAIDATNTCAQRFDGYKYGQVAGLSEREHTGIGLKTIRLHRKHAQIERRRLNELRKVLRAA